MGAAGGIRHKQPKIESAQDSGKLKLADAGPGIQGNLELKSAPTTCLNNKQSLIPLLEDAKMRKLQDIEAKLKENKDLLNKRFNVKEIGIFGSFVRGEQKETSDLDILVEFERSVSLFEIVRLERFLSELLGEKVDLVMKNSLKPRIGKHILREVVYV